jgi:PAS domain S-box-containing protein
MPKHDQLSTSSLKKYTILDADKEKLFDDIVTLAAEGCDKPFAMVSFIDDDKLQVTSQVGTFPYEIDRKNAFYELIINQIDVFEVPDTQLDKRTNLNEFVKKTPHIRYLAGVPLINNQGQILGTLCVFGSRPSILNKHQKSILKLLAKDVVYQLELRRKNRELSKLIELNQLITENNPDIIFAKDSNNKILHANTAFLSLFPEKMRDRVIGFSTLGIYSEEETAAFLLQDKLAFEQGKAEATEKILFPGGEIRTLFITKTRFEDDEGKAYLLVVARDVTDREALIEKLKKSNNDLDEFAYITSHDLKAPLNAIKRLVSWIEEDATEVLQGDSLEHFGMIKNRIDRMNMLLKDLLDYSRVGKNDGLPQKLSLQETAKNCCVSLDIPDNFIVDIDDVYLVLPKVPLELVLTNLISNAIKHHDEDSGRINIKCEQLKHDYQISVTDDGPGIEPALHEKVFMKFQTLKPRDELEASGLGLAIVEKVLANYLGNIVVKSDIGKGATFTVTWPKVNNK